MSIPKLTKIGLQNFKAFKDEEEFEIKPITLVYGYNSSGKSSFLHSLLFLDEFLRSGNVDVHYPTLGGGEVDLGGFHQFVNRHAKGECGPSVFKIERSFSSEPSAVGDGALDDFKAQYSFEVGGYNSVNPYLERISIYESFDDLGEPILDYKLEYDGMNPGKNLYRVSYFKSASGEGDWSEKFENCRAKFDAKTLSWDLLEYNKDTNEYQPFSTEGKEVNILLLNFHEEICNAHLAPLAELLSKIQYLGPLRSIPNRTELAWGTPGGKSDMEPWNRIRNELEVREKVNDVLAEIFPQKNGKPKYRFDVLEFGQTDQADEAVPDRGYYKNLSSDSSKVRDDILEKVSLIQQGDSDLSLSDIQEDLDKLEELEQLQVRVWAEKPKSLKKEKVIRKLVLLDLSDDENPIEVSLQDIGVGVGHVIPIIVAAVASKNSIILIESPEVYLHPFQQATLGSLFVECSMGENQNTFIVETHSEYILNKLMRKIGKTSVGQPEKNFSKSQVKAFFEPKPVTKDEISIYHVVQKAKDGERKSNKLELDEGGGLLTEWPEGFFGESREDILWNV